MHNELTVKNYLQAHKKATGQNHYVNVKSKQPPRHIIFTLLPMSCCGSQWMSAHSSLTQHEVHNHDYHTHLGY